MSNYEISISDGIDARISKKLSQISRESSEAATSTQKLMNELKKGGASKSYVGAAQKVIKSHLDNAKAASTAVTAQARLREAQIKGALAAQKNATAHTKASKGIVASGARMISIAYRYAAVLGATFTVGALVNVADSYTLIENKLKNVSKGTANLTKLTDESFQAANRARVPVEQFAQTYQRLDLALQASGTSQKEVLEITETASKMLLLGGATTNETGAAMLQLSQAFNKGKLDGDEFKTVMELMPSAADAISKQLGVTRGELLKLAPEGKITAKVMKDALAAAAEQIQMQFSKMQPTIAQSFTVMRNQAIKTFAKFDKAVGFTKKLSKIILKLSDNLHILVPIVATVGTTIVTAIGVNAALAFGAAASATAAWNAILLINPVVAVVTAIVAASAALYYFSDQITLGGEKMITLGQYGSTVIGLYKEGFRQLGVFIPTVWQAIIGKVEGGWGRMVKKASSTLKLIVNFYKQSSNTIIATFSNMVLTIGTVVSNLPTVFDIVFSTIYNAVITLAENIQNSITGAIDDVFFAIQSLPGGEAFFDALGGLKRTPEVNFERTEGLFGSTSSEQNDLLNDFAANVKAANERDYLGEMGRNLADTGILIKSEIGSAFSSVKNLSAQQAKLSRSTEMVDDQFEKMRKTVEKATSDGGSEASKKIREGRVHNFEPQLQHTNVSCGKASIAATLNNLNGTNLSDRDITNFNLLKQLNAKSDVIYEDVGDINNKTIEIWKKSNEKGYPVIFAANGNEFSSSGRGHIMVGTGIKGNEASFMDPASGSFRNTNFDALKNAGRHPDGNFVFAPKNINSLPSRNPKDFTAKRKLEKSSMKALESQIKAIKKDSLTVADLFIDMSKSQVEKYQKERDEIEKTQAEMAEYHTSLAEETALLGMSSKEAEIHSKWLGYSKEFQSQSNSMKEAEFKLLVANNQERAKQRDIEEEIINNSARSQSEEFSNTVNAMKEQGFGPGENAAFSNSELETMGIDTSALESGFLEKEALYESHLERINLLTEKGLLSESDASASKRQIWLEEHLERVGSYGDMFGSLATLTKTGNEKLVAVGKAAAIAQALVSTYTAAQLAYQSQIKFGPAFANIAAAGAVVSGLARVQQIRSQGGGKGFKDGGYTGSGGVDSVAGLVHGQEFVLNADTTRRLGVQNLNRLQNGNQIQGVPDKQRAAQAAPAPVVNTNTTVMLVPSKDAALAAMKGREGEIVMLEMIENNKTTVARLLQ